MGSEPTFHLALYQPQIPGNTGTLGRMCVGLNAHLHIIGPCAFDFSDAAVRRAGLDYWPLLRWTLHDDETAFLAWLGPREPWLVTETGPLRWDRADYAAGDVIVLGSEKGGLPAAWHRRWRHRAVHLPILGEVRTYNLANAGAAVLLTAAARSGLCDGYAPPPEPGGERW
jgi:tRNA (cytidine/uridine-2'-O-)-methyltransferase